MPIIITSKRDGFRRCGVAHAARPTFWPDGRWSEAELAQLQAEPMLVVEIEPGPDQAKAGRGKKAAQE